MAYTILSESPFRYNEDGGSAVAIKYSVSLEAEDGYTETQDYVATEETKEAVLDAALEEFCAAYVRNNAHADIF